MPISAHRALRTTARGLIAALFLLAFGRAEAQALVKVNDYVNFRLGILLQGQADFQQVANSANNDSGGWQQNMMLRRARFILGGQVAKDVFFYFDTENANLGKSTQTLTSGTTGVKAPTTGFNLLDAVGEWRAAKEFNVQFGEILVPINRWILTSSASTFMLDQSSYNIVPSTALQNNTGRDTGFMFRGYFFNDRLEYRSAFLSGFRQPGVKNAPRLRRFGASTTASSTARPSSRASASPASRTRRASRNVSSTTSSTPRSTPCRRTRAPTSATGKSSPSAGPTTRRATTSSARPTCSWTSRSPSARSSRRSRTSTSTAARSSRRSRRKTRSRPRRASSSSRPRSPRSSATNRRRSPRRPAPPRTSTGTSAGSTSIPSRSPPIQHLCA